MPLPGSSFSIWLGLLILKKVPMVYTRNSKSPYSMKKAKRAGSMIS